MRAPLLNEQSTVFRGASPHAVSEFVNQHIGTHRIDIARAGRRDSSLRHRRLGQLELCRLSYGRETRVRCDGLQDAYHLQLILKGRCSYDVGAGPLSLAAGHAQVLNPREGVDLTYSGDCEKFIVKLPTALFDQACAEQPWARPEQGVRFLPVPYAFQALESLLGLMSLMCQEAESGCAVPQVVCHYQRLLASKLLAMLGHNANPGLPRRSGCFERLARYIEDHIRDDIAVEDLAHFANISVRSLYLVFERHAGVSPKHYIRHKKLEHAYAAILDRACPLPNVTAVALEYGFTHLGRFSELYRAAFGRLPSESWRERTAGGG